MYFGLEAAFSMEIATLLASIVALLISCLAWHKSRVIYAVETAVIRQPTGGRDDLVDSTGPLNEKLKSGKYTVLSLAERRADGDWSVLLGRIS